MTKKTTNDQEHVSGMEVQKSCEHPASWFEAQKDRFGKPWVSWRNHWTRRRATQNQLLVRWGKIEKHVKNHGKEQKPFQQSWRGIYSWQKSLLSQICSCGPNVRGRENIEETEQTQKKGFRYRKIGKVNLADWSTVNGMNIGLKSCHRCVIMCSS